METASGPKAFGLPVAPVGVPPAESEFFRGEPARAAHFRTRSEKIKIKSESAAKFLKKEGCVIAICRLGFEYNAKLFR